MFTKKKQHHDVLPEGTYAEELAVYQIQHGWNSLDMTPEQIVRFRLVEAACGDAANAKRLVFARLRYRSGALSDEHPTEEMIPRAIGIPRGRGGAER
jgi:hypothetical protein